MRRKFPWAGVIAALTFTTGAAQAGVNSWTMTGPFGGNAISVAVHPTNPDIMLTQTAGGIYRSTDAGAHWTFITASGTDPPVAKRAFAFDPTDPGANRLFIAAIGVYRSDDAGRTFVPVTSPSTRGYWDIVVASDGMLFLSGQDGRVFRSGDRGQNWTELTVPWASQQNAYVGDLVVDPNAPERLYVAVSGLGIYRSEDRGATWVAPAAGSLGTAANSSSSVYSIAVQPGNSNRLLAGATYGFYSSADRGATWTSYFSFRLVNWVGFDPSAPNNAVAINSLGEVSRSVDGGATWPMVLAGETLDVQFATRAAFAPSKAGRLVVGTTDGPFISDNGGLTSDQRANGIRAGMVSDFAAADDGTLYAAYNYGTFGLYRRDSTGWTPLNNAALRAASNYSDLREIATAAMDSNRIYAISGGWSLVYSGDGGDTWSLVDNAYTINGLPQDVAVDPSDPDTVYVATYREGLWRTRDGGANWQRLPGLPDRIDIIAIDPANTRTLYVLTTDPTDGLFKSTDGGDSWAPRGGLTIGTRLGITFDPENTQTLYIYSGGGVTKSTDGGTSWTPLDFGPPGNTYARAMAVLVDPGAHNTIWVVSHPYTPGFTRSVDGGATWERVTLQVPQGDTGFLDEAILDPLRPNVIHIGATHLGMVEYEVAPDLAVSIEGLASLLAADGTASGSVTVRNVGPHAASAAELRIAMPAWMHAVVPQYCRSYPGELACELPPIRVGESRIVPLAVSLDPEAGTGTLTATVTGHERDPVASNDAAAVTVTSSTQARLGLVFDTATPTAGHGDSVTFNARLANPGPSRARESKLELQLGTLSAEEVTTSAGACTRTGATVSCNLGTLEAATVTVRALATAIGANTVTGTATRSGTGTGAADTASLTIQGRPVADFSVETTDSPDPVVSGGTVTFTSTVRNNGPDSGTAVYTMLTTGLTISNFSISNGICGVSGGVTVICTVNSLANGATATVTITAVAGAVGTATFSSTVIFDGIDRVGGNNQVASNTTITAPPSSGGGGGGGGKGGGGGRFDWLAAGLLGLLLVLRRRDRAPSAQPAFS